MIRTKSKLGLVFIARIGNNLFWEELDLTRFLVLFLCQTKTETKTMIHLKRKQGLKLEINNWFQSQ
jgi:hypothetical protein